ncbi:YggS family pyridoxal phosphate-dependent enzyme [Desulfurivibrio alkaliphilus]|uniref:Pyridoxal phosphate homeostasis protein n=1 Tax=Desulfurivibrio alkaliphilus (strain DSM 19089 / UNIQEM U267 / AHT2) TaxID=589865 RepID=D6Z0N6_DESAT|nr:YggS family pyridoxal phosphate-dependent enzyme [Desulfurivibrio alkaliphilus]ADH85265.1 alanine racemase domain protein [Desulfurivibrio alkaliphilus AHT 2]
MTDIGANLAAVKARIAAAARRSGRDPASVRLVAVSKRVEAERIVTAVAAGQRLFGENYLQEAQAKISRVNELLAGPEAGPEASLDPTGKAEVSWHFIGHLQSNKAKAAATTDFTMVETIDRLKLARALDRHAAAAGRLLPVLVQVNVGGEAQKAGVMPEQAPELLRSLAELPALRVMGLMTMPPMAAHPEESRPHFARLRQLAEEFARQGLLGAHGSPLLSMGMSADFEVAVEEGANLVRVGTAIFGPRQ